MAKETTVIINGTKLEENEIASVAGLVRRKCEACQYVITNGDASKKLNAQTSMNALSRVNGMLNPPAEKEAT